MIFVLSSKGLSGSSSAMHLEDRPNSVMGSGGNLHLISGPSSPSVISGDNYRRDWAHHLLTRGGSGVAGSGRASSVLSLHSAPPTTTSPSDNFRNSASDLSRLNGNGSPGFGRHRWVLVQQVIENILVYKVCNHNDLYYRAAATGQHQHRQNHTQMIPNYRQYSTSPPPSGSPVPSSSATDSFRQMVKH